MGLFRFDHKNIKNGILFNALYSAIIFAIMFIINDYIDIYFLPHLEKKSYNRYSTKFFMHICIIFIVSITVAYLLWVLFGWGKALTETC